MRLRRYSCLLRYEKRIINIVNTLNTLHISTSLHFDAWAKLIRGWIPTIICLERVHDCFSQRLILWCLTNYNRAVINKTKHYLDKCSQLRFRSAQTFSRPTRRNIFCYLAYSYTNMLHIVLHGVNTDRMLRAVADGLPIEINSSPFGQNGRHFSDNIFRCIIMNEKLGVLIRILVQAFVVNYNI